MPQRSSPDPTPRSTSASASMWALLRGVSRSFYLSIRLLPEGMREPVAVAYLLARATDTVADTTRIGAAQRRAQLRELAQLIQGESLACGSDAVRLGATLATTFAPEQQNSDEQALI